MADEQVPPDQIPPELVAAALAALLGTAAESAVVGPMIAKNPQIRERLTRALDDTLMGARLGGRSVGGRALGMNRAATEGMERLLGGLGGERSLSQQYVRDPLLKRIPEIPGEGKIAQFARGGKDKIAQFGRGRSARFARGPLPQALLGSVLMEAGKEADLPGPGGELVSGVGGAMSLDALRRLAARDMANETKRRLAKETVKRLGRGRVVASKANQAALEAAGKRGIGKMAGRVLGPASLYALPFQATEVIDAVAPGAGVGDFIERNWWAEALRGGAGGAAAGTAIFPGVGTAVGGAAGAFGDMADLSKHLGGVPVLNSILGVGGGGGEPQPQPQVQGEAPRPRDPYQDVAALQMATKRFMQPYYERQLQTIADFRARNPQFERTAFAAENLAHALPKSIGPTLAAEAIRARASQGGELEKLAEQLGIPLPAPTGG